MTDSLSELLDEWELVNSARLVADFDDVRSWEGAMRQLRGSRHRMLVMHLDWRSEDNGIVDPETGQENVPELCVVQVLLLERPEDICAGTPSCCDALKPAMSSSFSRCVRGMCGLCRFEGLSQVVLSNEDFVRSGTQALFPPSSCPRQTKGIRILVRGPANLSHRSTLSRDNVLLPSSSGARCSTGSQQGETSSGQWYYAAKRISGSIKAGQQRLP
ncbi:hypothetical protein BKA80DRAFT_256290 [Phyllosticta citrichinensis]